MYRTTTPDLMIKRRGMVNHCWAAAAVCPLVPTWNMKEAFTQFCFIWRVCSRVVVRCLIPGDRPRWRRCRREGDFLENPIYKVLFSCAAVAPLLLGKRQEKPVHAKASSN